MYSPLVINIGNTSKYVASPVSNFLVKNGNKQ